MTVEQETMRDELIAKLVRRPFKPFVVELDDGSRHFMVRIAQMAVGLTTAIVGDAAGDSSRHIKLSEVVAVKDL